MSSFYPGELNFLDAVARTFVSQPNLTVKILRNFMFIQVTRTDYRWHIQDMKLIASLQRWGGVED
jgi:hypothetical protein